MIFATETPSSKSIMLTSAVRPMQNNNSWCLENINLSNNKLEWSRNVYRFYNRVSKRVAYYALANTEPNAAGLKKIEQQSNEEDIMKKVVLMAWIYH